MLSFEKLQKNLRFCSLNRIFATKSAIMRKKHIILAFFAILIIYGACVDEEETGSDGQTEYVYDQDNPNTWQKTEWSADDIPMVHLRDSTRYVCDPENIMQEVYRDSADMVLAQLERNYQIESVFIIVSHVKGGDTFRMAQDVGNKYGVGRKETNRGLVMVIAVEDHMSFIAPGRGLEGDLTDLLCGRIGDTYISGNMRRGDPDHAVLQTCQAIYDKLSTGLDPVLDQGAAGGGEDEFSWWSFVVLMIICLFVLYCQGSGRSGGGGGFSAGSGGWSGGWSGGGSWSGGGGGSFGGGSFGGGGASSSW